MSLEEKLDKQFSKFEVAAPNAPLNLEHIYADYIELIALFSRDNYVTSMDIIDRLNDEGVLRLEESEDESLEIGSDAARARDGHEVWSNEQFKILEERATIFGDDYPFSYEDRKIKIKTALTYKQQLYIALLISSNLDHFTTLKSELTSDFETISYHVLKSYLPTRAVIKSFGENADYNGTAIDKIKLLATDMNIDHDEYELDNISEKNTKERGLDLVGWIPFDDNCPNFVTILAQCACGKKWPEKQHDTRRFVNYFKWHRLRPAHALFIPYCLMNLDGSRKFYRSDDIVDETLLFERRRILHLFGSEAEFNALDSKRIVQRCLIYAEDIV
jgi:hypothetical protein